MIRKALIFPAGAILRVMNLALTALFLINLALPVYADGSEELPPAEEMEFSAERMTEETEMPDGGEGRSEETLTAAEPILLQSVPALFADSAEDPNFILVEKTFSGLPADRIPEGFYVTVSSGGSVYTLDKENTLSRSTDGEGNTVWRWRILGVGTGSYTVLEAGAEVDGYTVQSSGEGTVEVKAADMTVFVPVHETTCSHTDWPVRVEGDSSVLFAATLTQRGVAVISAVPLSASQRAAVSQAVLRINGPWKTPVYFYSIEEQLQSGKGFELNGASITYDASRQEVVIGQTRNWQHVATLTYSVSEASNPEIALINRYTPSTTAVTVRKTVTGNMAEPGKSFDFTVSVKDNGEDAAFRVNGTAYTGSADFSLKHGESIRLEDVPIGASVTVTEADYAPERYIASYTVDDAQAVSGRTAAVPSVRSEGHTVLFTNRKDYFPDTGVRLDTLPYLVCLGAASVGLALLLRLRKRDSR